MRKSPLGEFFGLRTRERFALVNGFTAILCIGAMENFPRQTIAGKTRLVAVLARRLSFM